jgi:hypothetical protein
MNWQPRPSPYQMVAFFADVYYIASKAVLGQVMTRFPILPGMSFAPRPSAPRAACSIAGGHDEVPVVLATHRPALLCASDVEVLFHSLSFPVLLSPIPRLG